MLRSRHFWTGIGCGFIVGAIILQLMLWSKPADTQAALNLPSTSLSVDELKQQAEQLGYELLPSDITWLDSEQVEAEWEQRERQIREDAENDAPTIRSFIIVPGMTSDDVADMLLQLGLINDKEYFKSLLTKDDLHRTLQARLYVFYDEPKVEEIIEKITKNDLD